jgi:hypothetical protein
MTHKQGIKVQRYGKTVIIKSESCEYEKKFKYLDVAIDMEKAIKDAIEYGNDFNYCKEVMQGMHWD